MAGRFIVLEGIDGAGTTTQAQRLAHRIIGLGQKCHITAEPSGGPIGLEIRRLLSVEHKPESTWPMLGLLFAADRLHHLKNEIESLLEAGTHVVCDRYVLSSLVYQGLHLEGDWVRALNREARAPDLTLFVDVSLEEARTRRHVRGGAQELYDDDDLQRRLIEGYRRLAPTVNARTVDGSGDVDTVENRIWSVVGPEVAPT
jgi:dTMP kinase